MVTEGILTALYTALYAAVAVLCGIAVRQARRESDRLRDEVREGLGRVNKELEAVSGPCVRTAGAVEVIGENTEKILDQMDEISSAAALTDRVTQGMNSLMNYSGEVRKGGS